MFLLVLNSVFAMYMFYLPVFFEAFRVGGWVGRCSCNISSSNAN